MNADIDQRIANLSPEKRALLEERLAKPTSARSRPALIEHNANQVPVPSYGQEILWALELIENGGARFNISYSFHMEGTLDVAALQSALRSLVNRHETLRARYRTSADGRLTMEFTPASEVSLSTVDLGGSDHVNRDQLLQSALKEEGNRPIALDCGPLCRAVLYRMGERKNVLQLTVHHVACDGWSMGILFRDFSALYNAEAAGAAVQLPDLPITFSDYARWQRERLGGPEGERLIAYWKNQLTGSTFVLELPTDRPRPPQQTFFGDTREYSMSSSSAAAMRQFCVKEKVTPFMVWLACLFAVLARYTSQSSILIGVPIAARTQIETEELVGFFTNTIVFRGNLEGDPSFQELVGRIRQSAFDAYAHQDLPLELLIGKLVSERDPSRQALFQVMFAFQNAPVYELDLHGPQTFVRRVNSDTSKVDFSIDLTPTDVGAAAAIEYNTDLFDPGTIDRLWGHLEAFLLGAIASPGKKIATIPLLTSPELHRLVVEWNDTRREYPREATVASLVEAQVERTPDAIAVTDGDQRLTYKELNEQANQLARKLRDHGAGPDQLIGLCAERSVAMVVTLLAIAKSGAAYLPLDPLLPVERLGFMAQDSGLRVLLTEPSLRTRFASYDGETILLDDRSWRESPSDNLALVASSEDLAYVIYTPGSTGKPKGVQIPNRALTNFLWSMRAWREMSEHDRLLAVTTISFDIAGL